jgi:hypothetical protein
MFGVVGILATAEHPWRLDIGATAAIAAAVGTVALAAYTARLARSTKELAVETGDDLRAEWRPVLLPAIHFDLSVNREITSGGQPVEYSQATVFTKITKQPSRLLASPTRSQPLRGLRRRRSPASSRRTAWRRRSSLHRCAQMRVLLL